MNNKIVVFLVLAISLLMFACTNNANNNDLNNDSLSDDLNISLDNNSQNEHKPINTSKAAYSISAVEGDLVRIPVRVHDPDGGDVKLSFSEPFNDEGLWLTEIGDEGQYLVKVSVVDGLLTTSEYVLINVARANRPPVVDCPERVVVEETETVKLDCNIFDEDGDPVIVSYEGWMTSSLKKTDYGDEGAYSVLVRARDAEHEITRTVSVIVKKKNRPPVIDSINKLSVLETETIRVSPVVSDPDGDDITLSFSAPLSVDGSWTPDFGDRGEYEVTITASDGMAQTTEDFTLVVERRNRAPVIKSIDAITVLENEVVSIPVQAYDPDGDDVFISFSGWMNSSEYKTTYEDARPLGCSSVGCTATYYVTVTVSDGVLETSELVEIKVVDKNRAPELIFG